MDMQVDQAGGDDHAPDVNGLDGVAHGQVRRDAGDAAILDRHIHHCINIVPASITRPPRSKRS